LICPNTRPISPKYAIGGLTYHEKLDDIDLEINNVNVRLDKLYDALETGKLNLDELAPRIKQLKSHQDEISKIRVMMEAEMATKGVKPLDAVRVKEYVHDLAALLTETDIIRSKSFLRSFIEKIVIYGSEGKIHYKLPVPSKWQEQEEFSVLPIEPPSGEGGTRTHQQLFTNQSAPDEQPLIKILQHLAAIGKLSQEFLSSIQHDSHISEPPPV
jgi:hypothetical protein